MHQIHSRTEQSAISLRLTSVSGVHESN